MCTPISSPFFEHAIFCGFYKALFGGDRCFNKARFVTFLHPENLS